MFNPESSRNFKDTWGTILPPEKKSGVKIPGPEAAPANDDAMEGLTDLAEEVIPAPKPGSEAERVLKEMEAEQALKVAEHAAKEALKAAEHAAKEAKRAAGEIW